MKLRIAKWRNGLALRIPVEVVRSLGIKEGDCVEASLTIDGALTIRPTTSNRKAFAQSLAAARATTMPLGKSVIDEMRRGGRYWLNSGKKGQLAFGISLPTAIRPMKLEKVASTAWLNVSQDSR